MNKELAKQNKTPCSQVDLGVNVCSLQMKNPIITASGTCGYGVEMSRFYDVNILGAICLKGTTLHSRFGNATPRIAECPSGMLNSVGLENVGIDNLIEEKIPALRKIYDGKIIANISGFEVDEFATMAEKLDASSAQIDAIEVNISCPNVHGGGLAFGTNAKSAAQVTRAVRRSTKLPVFVKLSPNVSDIAEIALACQDEGADGLCLINTLLGMRVNMRTKKPLLANITGGLSGQCIFPVALRAVYQTFSVVNIPIIGVGGISSASDVCEMMLCGASAVQIGSANLINPFVCQEIIQQLPALCKTMGVSSIEKLKGGAHG